MPVFEHGEGLAGAMSLSGPNERFTSERVAVLGMLLCAANGMAQLLGGDASAGPSQLSRSMIRLITGQ